MRGKSAHDELRDRIAKDCARAVGYEIESRIHTGVGGRKIRINAVNVVNVVINNEDWGKGESLEDYLAPISNGINAINDVSPTLSPSACARAPVRSAGQ